MNGTLVGNTGPSFIYFANGTKNFTAYNSIIFGNYTAANGTTNSTMYANSGTITKDIKYSLVQNETDNLYTDPTNKNLVSTTDPKFNNPTAGDYSLAAGSPAINAGSNTLYTQSGGNLSVDKDLAGNARVYDLANGGIIDMGAYEYQGTLAALEVNKQVIQIYPNPTNGELHIKTPVRDTVSIYNLTGQLVKTVSLQSGDNVTDISNLPTGIYILKTTTGSYKVIKK